MPETAATDASVLSVRTATSVSTQEPLALQDEVKTELRPEPGKPPQPRPLVGRLRGEVFSRHSTSVFGG